MVFEKETNLYQDAAIRSKFASQDTQFSVIQGKISYLITDSEIATYDDGKGTITSRMNSAENTVSEHSSTIFSMQSEIDGVTGDVEEFHSTYNAFVQNTEGTFSQVSETLSTKTHVFRDQPAPPYNEGDFWIKDKELYVCVNSKEESESYSAADWIPSTKGRVFTTTPTVPYNAGDMWMQGSTGDIKICTVTRTSGSYNAADWSNASRYIGNADLTTWYNNNLKDVIEGLEDGEIKTYYQPSDPSSGWTSEEKPKHQGDIWYCSSTTGNYAQKYYRWSGTAWQQMTAMPPSDVIKTISGKGTIFASQPTTAQIYHVGDLWVNARYPANTGAMYDNEILRCNTEKAAGSPFNIDHWEKASKYTDDSTLTNWLTNTYATDKNSLQDQIDGKIETWSQANDPSTAWGTAELRAKHAGDMWFCSATTGNRAQKYYRWDGSQWLEVTAEPPTAIVNTINAKANIFTGSGRPAPPYKIGDLWFNSTSDNTGEIYTCVVPRESGGSPAASDWRIRNKYTDDSTFTRWRTTTYNSFINQLPNEINLQVTGSETTTAGEVFTGKGDIILNINNTLQSEATISANKINLEAYSTATENEAMAKADYIGSVAPTLNNYPASTWANDTVKSAHIGETYYNKETELTYYFKGVPNNGMLITFDSHTATEPQNPTSGRIYDYFQIFFMMDGMLFESKKYCGEIGALEFFIPSNTFWIYWHTDNSGQDYYGFSFSSVATVSGRSLDPNVVSSIGLPDFEAVETNNITTIATAHNPYAANDDKLWKFTANFPVDTDKTFSWTRTEEIAPYIDAKASVIVTSEGLMSKVSAGAIASTINQTAQSVLIDASKINLQGYLTITDVGDSGSTVISGSRITTGTISADRVMGGTFKAGGSSSGTSGKNGAIEIYDSSNSRIARFDSSGWYMGNIASSLSSPTFSINTDGKVSIKLSTSLSSKVEMSTGGMIYSCPNQYNLSIGSDTVYSAPNYRNAIPIMASKTPTGTRYIMALYNEGIAFNTSTTTSAPNVFGSQGLQVGTTSIMDNYDAVVPGFGSYFAKGTYVRGNLRVSGNCTVEGVKPRLVSTKDYASRYLYCYETATPMFGDVGEGVIGEDGRCYIHIDPIYSETVNLSQYQVFLQKYGDGECYVERRESSFFVVSGTPSLAFGWEIKARQNDFNQYRLEKEDIFVNEANKVDYIDDSLSHIDQINEERKTA